jgi:hypothetical protein
VSYLVNYYTFLCVLNNLKNLLTKLFKFITALISNVTKVGGSVFPPELLALSVTQFHRHTKYTKCWARFLVLGSGGWVWASRAFKWRVYRFLGDPRSCLHCCICCLSFVSKQPIYTTNCCATRWSRCTTYNQPSRNHWISQPWHWNVTCYSGSLLKQSSRQHGASFRDDF